MPRLAPAVLLVVFLPFLASNPAGAQPTQTAEAFYLKFGQGASDLSGNAGMETGISDFFDPEKFNSDDLQYVFALEMGYRLSASSSFGVGYQLGSYYHPDGAGLRAGSERLHTIQVLARYKLGARSWRVTPYLDLGANVSSGVEKIGGGPSIGAGFSIVVDNRMSIFLESRLNFSIPSQTADTEDDFGPQWMPFGPRWIYSSLLSEGAPFNVLSSLPALGVEIDLR